MNNSVSRSTKQNHYNFIERKLSYNSSMVNRDKEIPFTRVWVLVLLDIVTMKFGSFGYCDYEGLVLLDIVTMNVTILAKEQ